MLSQQLSKGMLLLVLGMAIVFIFLTLLVLVTKTVSKTIIAINKPALTAKKVPDKAELEIVAKPEPAKAQRLQNASSPAPGSARLYKPRTLSVSTSAEKRTLKK